jgi:carbonic anhydrase
MPRLSVPRKRKSSESPTQRSLSLLRGRGYTVAITEHWNPHARVRADLFGFIDVLAVASEMIAVQTTSGSNVAKRVSKIVSLEAARVWLESGHKIMVHGWAKRGPRGEVKKWTCREVEVTLEDFGE